MRLQKVMAEAGIGSRRACEALIEEGRVAVNGEVVVRMPVMVDPGRDRISVDGEPLRKYMPEVLRTSREDSSRTTGAKAYVMLYKPRHTLSTSADPEGRRTVVDMVKHSSGLRLYPVGRLDYEMMGLVLLTNDGELANKLTHPRFGIEKTYRAIIKGRLDDEAMAKLGQGARLVNDRDGLTETRSKTAGVEVRIIQEEASRSVIDLTLKEGRNRQVRFVLAKLGCPVRKLVRIAMGPLSLKGLKVGEWRDLRPEEVRLLHAMASGKGPKGLDERSRMRSHAMKIGASRAEVAAVDDGDAMAESEGATQVVESTPARVRAGSMPPEAPRRRAAVPFAAAEGRERRERMSAGPSRRTPRDDERNERKPTGRSGATKGSRPGGKSDARYGAKAGGKPGGTFRSDEGLRFAPKAGSRFDERPAREEKDRRSGSKGPKAARGAKPAKPGKASGAGGAAPAARASVKKPGKPASPAKSNFPLADAPQRLRT